MMKKSQKYTQNVIISTPFLVLTLAIFIYIASRLNIAIAPKVVVYGAIGWWVALLLRLPIGLVSKKLLATNKVRALVIAASGPCEEITRLIVLIVLGRTVSNGYSLGLGWAGLEVLYSVVQGVAMGTLSSRSDPKAEQAKLYLREQGLDKSLEPSAPFWGILERVGANATHLGFSLLIVFSPWVVLLTVPLHSFLNFYVSRSVKSSFLKAEMGFVAVAVVVFTAGLYLAM